MLQIIPEEESKMFVARSYSRSKMITVGFWRITCGVFNLSVLFILFLTCNPLGLQFRDALRLLNSSVFSMYVSSYTIHRTISGISSM